MDPKQKRIPMLTNPYTGSSRFGKELLAQGGREGERERERERVSERGRERPRERDREGQRE